MEKLLCDNVLSSIFTRLPAKQLARMRCVSKPWNAALSNPYFVKSHLHRSMQHNKYDILLHFPVSFLTQNDHEFTAHSTSSPHIKLTNFVKLPVNGRGISDVIGSVNGLICFKTYGSTIPILYIWNPSLGALLTLPPYTIPSCDYDIRWQFGYDPKTDDYKVVKLTFSRTEVSRLAKEWHQLEAYSTRHGFWKLMTQRFPSHVTKISYQNEVCVDGQDGRLHWLCFVDKTLSLQSVIAFNLSVENFHEIPLPDSIKNKSANLINVLGFTTGKLCAMSCVYYKKCEVWVMNEYGVAESWVKRHVFSEHHGIRRPIGFTLNNDFIFESFHKFIYDPHHEYSIAFYDQVTCKVRPFMISIPSHGLVKIVPYVDSLVWVAPAKHGLNITSVQL